MGGCSSKLTFDDVEFEMKYGGSDEVEKNRELMKYVAHKEWLDRQSRHKLNNAIKKTVVGFTVIPKLQK